MNPDLPPLLLDGTTVRLTVAEGRITQILPVAEPARAVILPLAIDPHVHLDKCFTAGRCRATKPGLFGAIEAMAGDKANWTHDDLYHRITRGLAEAYAHGTAALRSHVDWTEPPVPLAWSVMGEAAAAWSDRLTLQRAALVSLDLLNDPAHGPRIARRVAQDGGVLGGFVYRHPGHAQSLARAFALAADHGLMLDFHVDEGLDADATGLDVIADLTRHHGMAGRVLCGHACSLSIRPDAEDAMARAAEAGLALTILPTTNLHLQDMAPGRSPRLRGLAPAQELRKAGVPVLFGTDNVRDPFFPYGAHDPVDMLRLACLSLHLRPEDWADAITTSAARALGLNVPRLEIGAVADFILLEGADWAEAISQPRAPRQIFRAGRAQTQDLAA